MRYLKIAAVGVLALGMSSYAALGTMKAGVAYQGAEPDNGAYRPGMGVNGFVDADRPMGATAGGLGLRADYEHYVGRRPGHRLGSERGRCRLGRA